MVRLFSGDGSGSLSYFNENINPENYQYYAYFKGLALKASGKDEEANKAFSEIATINFSNWNIAIVRRLANKQLGQT